jgi:membrane protein DedA with SNARE-associated domain
METLINLIVEAISKLGYAGIFVGMAVESSFIPFPSEVIMIPAGYLVHKGEMNLYAVIFCGIAGSLVGAIVNYVLAKTLARAILVKYGRYFFISEKMIEKTEVFFKKHGEISTLTGRLLPGIRQVISIPAGAFNMPFGRFVLLTAVGSGIWVSILAIFGFYLGQNADLIKQYSLHLKVGGVLLALIFAIVYLGARRLMHLKALKKND